MTTSFGIHAQRNSGPIWSTIRTLISQDLILSDIKPTLAREMDAFRGLLKIQFGEFSLTFQRQWVI